MIKPIVREMNRIFVSFLIAVAPRRRFLHHVSWQRRLNFGSGIPKVRWMTYLNVPRGKPMDCYIHACLES